jgi:hypothetical protein
VEEEQESGEKFDAVKDNKLPASRITSLELNFLFAGYCPSRVV